MASPTRERFRLLWNALSATGDSDPAYDALMKLYAEPHRHYHTATHIKHCLALFDEERHHALRPAELEFAIWYHDAIYDPISNDNESASASLAWTTLTAANVPNIRLFLIVQHIMATQHLTVPVGRDDQFIVDIDLGILGESVTLFDAYEVNIRKEYSFVPDAIFATKRTEILRRFLERPSIYTTRHFRNKFEAAARANLERSIAKLALLIPAAAEPAAAPAITSTKMPTT